MADKIIRMATSENDDEQGHTIVGGRPQAPRSMRSDIPHALEILVKRAAIDADFKKDLLTKRDKIADELKIPLDSSERAMLDCIPAEHLEKMIQATEVPPAQRKILAKGTTAAMIALLAQLTFAPVAGRAEAPAKINIRPTNSSSKNSEDAVVKGIRPDIPAQIKLPVYEDHLADRGARPDLPDPLPNDEDIIFPDENLYGLESTEPSAPEFAKVVSIAIAGKKLSEALKLIEKNTGLKMNVTGIDNRLGEYIVESDVSGLPVKMAIETLCLETSSEVCEFEIIWYDEPPTVEINFQEIIDQEPINDSENQLNEIPIVKPDQQQDSAIIRGIRSDFPEIVPFDMDKGDKR